MSRRTVRAIAQRFLTVPPIPGLPVVQRGWDNQMQLVAAGGTTPDQTLACLHMPEGEENRLSTPAVLGWRMVDHQMQLQVCHLLDGSGDDMADSTDDMIEAIVERLHSDPLMGQLPQAIFQNAQGKNPQIRYRVGDIQYINTGTANGTPVQWFFIEWTATEQVIA
jgi:hypothetical protein